MDACSGIIKVVLEPTIALGSQGWNDDRGFDRRDRSRLFPLKAARNLFDQVGGQRRNLAIVSADERTFAKNIDNSGNSL